MEILSLNTMMINRFFFYIKRRIVKIFILNRFHKKKQYEDLYIILV